VGTIKIKTASVQNDQENSWDAIVIGSGMGGMACAASLAKYRRKVLVCEQHYVAGGFTHTFSRKGFTWDVGVHCLGEMGPRDIPGQLIQWLSNGKVEMHSMGPTYETLFFPEGYKIEFPDTAKKFRDRLETSFPNDKSAIAEYFKLIRKVSESARIFFALRAMPEWLDRLVSHTLFKSGKKYWAQTTAEVLDTLTKNEKLKAVLTAQWGYYGSIPKNSSFAIHALTVKHFWNGGYYPANGSHTIAENLMQVVKDAGGSVKLRTPIETLLIENGKAIGVRTQLGQEYYASKIISAVGAKTTINSLLPAIYRTSSWAKSISDLKQSPSYICLNLGFEGDILAAGATVSNQWFFETWSMEAPEWDVSDLNSFAPLLYLSFPSLKDPKYESGPHKRHTGEVVTFVPWACFEKWKDTRRGKRDREYADFKKTIEERIILQLRKHIPNLMDLMTYHELSTPLSTLFFTRAPQGAIYGLEATPNRFMSKQLRTRTPVKNLFLAGGDVATLGVTGALVGGILAAATIEPRVFTKLIRPRSKRKKQAPLFQNKSVNYL
jgi:all-trans-retinol 13,14-reductase